MNQPNPPPRPGGPGQTQLPVELPDDVAQGTYSNLMFITHSPSEFVLDFARALPGTRKYVAFISCLLLGKGGSASKAATSLAPSSPLVPGSKISSTRQASGKGTFCLHCLTS